MEKISPELAAAFIKAKSEIGIAINDSKNGAYKDHKYASMLSILAVAKPALTNNGFAIFQQIVPSDDAVVNTFLIYKTGEFLDLGAVRVPVSKKDAHGYCSGLSYAERYGIKIPLNIPSDDDDGNAAVGISDPKEEAAKAQFLAEKKRIEESLAASKVPVKGRDVPSQISTVETASKVPTVYIYDLTTMEEKERTGWEAKFTAKGRKQLMPHIWQLGAEVKALEAFRVK